MPSPGGLPGSGRNTVAPIPTQASPRWSGAIERHSLLRQSIARALALLLVSTVLSLLVSAAFYWFVSQRSVQMWTNLIEQQYRTHVVDATLDGWREGARTAAFALASTGASGGGMIEHAWAEARQFGADTVATINHDGTWHLAHGALTARLPAEGASLGTGWWIDGDADQLYRVQFDFSQTLAVAVFYPIDRRWLERHRIGYERVSLHYRGIELNASTTASQISASNPDTWLNKASGERSTKIYVTLPLDASAYAPLLKVQHLTISPFTLSDMLVSALLLLILLVVAGWATVGRWLLEALKRIENLAYRDPLTGLLNRHSLHLKLAAILADTRQDRNPGLALLMIDLDRFKELNDTGGHHAGDRLLMEIGRRLGTELRRDDTVARMGGDEFLAIISGVRTKAELTEIASRLIEVLSQPVPIAVNQSWTVGASIGIAIYPDDAKDQATLLGHADLALYQAKRLGRGRHCFYDAQLSRDALIRIPLSSRRQADLPLDQFWLAYQPIVCAKTGGVTGIEALLRWNHPELGAISPAQFIPIAEETGIIGRLGLHVLEQACKQLDTWRRMQTPQLASCQLYVNFSGQQLKDPKLAVHVQDILQRTGVAAQRLVIEITETSFIEITAEVGQCMNELRALGIALAIDDFGTGHSSLSLISKMPVQILKLAGEFTDQLNHPEGSHSVCLNVLSLARSLGLATVAEGVETPEQGRLLAEMGYDRLQGFHFAKPMTAEDVLAWLRQRVVAVDFAAAASPPAAAANLKPALLPAGG